MATIDNPSVQRVIAALNAAGHDHTVRHLDDTARSAGEAAAALGVEVGAIVKTLVFALRETGGAAVALIAGDRKCDTDALAAALGHAGGCRRPDADFVKAVTGYSIGGVSPVALPADVPVVMDHSLSRFDLVWAAAGHPHCVFPATPDQIRHLAAARISDAIGRQ